MTAITLLDGSIGQELVHRSGETPTALWSTKVMAARPDLVREVHAAYFDAGATVASTNTYALHRDRLESYGDPADWQRLIDTALDQAVAARDSHGAGRVAACLGPLGASYRPDLCPPADEAAPLYAELVQIMGDRPDLYLLETCSSVDQARGALQGTLGRGKPVWLAMSVSDADGTRLRSGEPLADLGPLLKDLTPDAVLINCSPPEAVTQAMPILARMGLPFGAYANGFTRIDDGFLSAAPTVDALTARKDLTPEAYTAHALTWLGHGATILGGCCEVGPAHIAHLAQALRDRGHTIT